MFRITAMLQMLLISTTLWLYMRPDVWAAEEPPVNQLATLLDKVQVPLEMHGEKVGETSLPPGTQVTVVSRDGSQLLIKRGNVGPVWIDESKLQLVTNNEGEQQAPSSESIADPERIALLISARKWQEVAHACQTLVQTDQRYSSLAETATAFKLALQARTGAIHQQHMAAVEAQRLQRNLQVLSQPNLLNPGDRGLKKRADNTQSEMDSVLKEARIALESSEKTLVQLGEIFFAFLIAPTTTARDLQDIGRTDARPPRIGERLSMRGKQLELPPELTAMRVNAYEFERGPYIIVAFLGEKGAATVVYYKLERFTEIEALDLIRRNAPAPAEITNMGSWTYGPQSWLVPDLRMRCYLRVSPVYSQLEIRGDITLMDNSKNASGSFEHYCDEFLKTYFEELNTSAIREAVQQQSQANEGL